MASTNNVPGSGWPPNPPEIFPINSADQAFLILDQQAAPAFDQSRCESRLFSENENSLILCKESLSRHRACGSRLSANQLHISFIISCRSGAVYFQDRTWVKSKAEGNALMRDIFISGYSSAIKKLITNWR